MQQVTPAQAIQIARQHHQAGRLAEAEALYQKVLAQVPDHGDALHLLGVVAAQSGRLNVAIDLIGRAIVVNPSAGDYRTDLGNALREAKRFGEAADAYLHAVRLRPESADAQNNLGHALRELGNTSAAIAAYREALRLRPDHADAMKHLAMMLTAQGDLDEAIEAYRQAVQLDPQSFELYYNLGVVLVKRGRFDEAVAAYTSAIQLKPTFFDAHGNLGYIFESQGRYHEANACHTRAIELRPDSAGAHFNLGNALAGLGESDEAIAAYKKAIKLDPQFAMAFNNLGNVLKKQGKLQEAADAYTKTIELDAGDPRAWDHLGSVRKDQGLTDEALACFARAMALAPENAAFHSDRLYTLHLHPGYDAAAIYAEHRKWNQQHAVRLRPPAPESLQKLMPVDSHAPDPDRRLKIGYVSPDLKTHPVGRFLLPLLARHDHGRFEVFCYADVRNPDGLTEGLRRHADTWRNIVGLSDEQVAGLIARDGIDILVDLTMHSGENRLLVFARKPAPVQVTYLAYCSTTGLDTMDYRLTDPFLDPPGQQAGQYSEQSVHLPQTYWCYAPGTPMPQVGRLPALAGDGITFGCLNNFSKVSTATLTVWSQLLRAAPRSHLFLHCREGNHRDRVIELFEREHVDPARLKFVGKMSMPEYFRLYQEIDIGLDPFPYAGGTTTCDALWMGVPVVTLAGRTAVGRAGVSILSNAGLPELIAQSEDQYVRLAAALSTDLPRLASLRSGLREQMAQSPLCDALRFARCVEAAYREMWSRLTSASYSSLSTSPH